MRNITISSVNTSLHRVLQTCLSHATEQAHWAEFIRRSKPIIAAVIVKEVYRWNRSSITVVDDLVQETYLKLCLNDFKVLRQSEFRHEAALFGFLKVVASNTARDYFRRIFSPKRGGKAGEVAFDEAVALFISGQSVKRIDRAILIQKIDYYLLSVVNAHSRCRDRLIFWAYYREGLTAKLISQIPGVGLGIKGVESAILRMTRQLKVVMNA